jgi:integrase
MLTTSLPRGIRRRGTSLLVDVTENGQRRTATVSGLDVTEAKRVQATLRAELLNGGPGATAKVWTLQEGLNRAMKVFWNGSLGERTAMLNAEAVLDYFGGTTTLDKISCDDMDAFVEQLQDGGNSNGTINRKLAVISKVFKLAVERSKESGLTTMPTIHRQKEGIGRVRWLTQAEEARCLSLLSQWSKDDHAEAFIVLVDTGMRLGELFRMTGRDCTFGEQAMLEVWGRKNGTFRTIPMTTRVQDILKRRMEITHAGPLFPFDNRWYRHTWDRMKTVLGLDADDQFVPHALRHTCASRLVQRGVTLLVVKVWMGHKSILTTQRYAHLAASNLLDAVRVLEAL